MNTPEEAVQAAHAAICEQNFDDCLDPEWRGKCVKAVEAAAPHMQDQLALDEFMPTRWWRALGLVGRNVLAETSNPRDFKSLGLSDESGAIFQRMYEARSSKWVDEKPHEVDIK